MTEKLLNAEHTNLIQSYGRKRSRGLSAYQADVLSNSDCFIRLPLDKQLSDCKLCSKQCEEIAPASFFHHRYDRIFLEIGFGKGEHLINNAMQNPNVGFIGCEPFENGVASALSLIKEKNIKNIMIFKDDARVLIKYFPRSSIERAYVLFPDPWRKKRHYKRRLLSVDFLRMMQEKITNQLIVATDSESYISTSLENLSKTDFSYDVCNLSDRPKCFLGTRYEQKALSCQKACYYLRCYTKP